MFMRMPERVLAETDCNPFRLQEEAGGCGRGEHGHRRLVAETGAHGYTLAADGAAAAEDGCAGLGLHTRTETVSLHAFAAIGLKCALGHENALLFPKENLDLYGNIQCIAGWARNPAGSAPGKRNTVI
jgi:hypothetical protein